MMARTQNPDGVWIDISGLSWFEQCKSLLSAEGDETYITRTGVSAVGITNTAGEGRSSSL
jgi:hypothetical protein